MNAHQYDILQRFIPTIPEGIWVMFLVNNSKELHLVEKLMRLHCKTKLLNVYISAAFIYAKGEPTTYDIIIELPGAMKYREPALQERFRDHTKDLVVYDI